MTTSHRSPDAFPRSNAPSCKAGAVLRAAGCLGVLGLLSACAGGQQITASQEASQYEQHAHRSYSAPGSSSDPWGPYVHEASQKYDVPERWIREVMRVESGGRTEMNGIPITSGAGAMGLMQVMPATYDELRGRYPDLTDDPYDPHNSILAGAAYIRELYDLYGNPGFLAAYNGGPGRLDDYLTRNRALPEETRRYVAKIGPYITDSFPTRRSTAEMYALDSVPTNIPAGPRYPAAADVPYTPAKPAEPPPVEVAFAPPSNTDGAYDAPARKAMPYVAPPAPAVVASAAPPAAAFEPAPMPASEPDLLPVPRPSAVYNPVPARAEPPAARSMQAAMPVPPPPRQTQVAALPEPPRYAPVPTVQTASAYGYLTQAHNRDQGFRLVSPAMAAPAPAYRGSPGEWAIQVGAFGNEGLARIAAGEAKEQGGTVLSSAHQAVAGVHEPHGTLYRARLTGLSRDAATQACERLRGRSNCIVLSPDAQS